MLQVYSQGDALIQRATTLKAVVRLRMAQCKARHHVFWQVKDVPNVTDLHNDGEPRPRGGSPARAPDSLRCKARIRSRISAGCHATSSEKLWQQWTSLRSEILKVSFPQRFRPWSRLSGFG